jgi:hypothetical protein
MCLDKNEIYVHVCGTACNNHTDAMQNVILSLNLFSIVSFCVYVEQFKYLGMTVTNQNLIQEEIKSRLNSGNA